jgi:hypothetical protein
MANVAGELANYSSMSWQESLGFCLSSLLSFVLKF